jgi:hypothetical protein
MTANDERAIQAARNQTLFRAVNERINTLNEHFSVLPIAEWVCECADDTCTERIQLTPAEYEAIRKHPNRFPILPGHELVDVEVVVEAHDRYLVVEKLGAAKDYATAHDPRA